MLKKKIIRKIEEVLSDVTNTDELVSEFIKMINEIKDADVKKEYLKSFHEIYDNCSYYESVKENVIENIEPLGMDSVEYTSLL